MTNSTVRWVPCPNCRRSWPHPQSDAPTQGVYIDWTCPICLHAEIAQLKRTLMTLTSGREDSIEQVAQLS